MAALTWSRAVVLGAIIVAPLTLIWQGLLHADANTERMNPQGTWRGAATAGSTQQQHFGPMGVERELDRTKCEPESVPDSQRCTYVWSNPSCSPKSGLLNYLALYYCIDNPPIAGALMLGWLLLLFCAMYVASDAFFCPTLELISDHLNLSPAVAGATLLAFGNGAPDLMSIIASMHSGAKGGGPVAPASVSMALSEPLGTGLFVGNVVLGSTVLMSRASREVAICPYHFFKDVAFYLTALGTILYCLLVGEAHLWQGVCILVLYIAYMSISIFMPREEEKDAIQHPELLTLVPHGPWDDIPSEDVEGASWEDVMSEANGGSSTADPAGWSPTAAAAGFGGYFGLWGAKKHKGGLLRSWASGELLRGWSAEQQQWIEPGWHRLCDSEDPHEFDDGVVGLGQRPSRKAKKLAMSRRWSYGDVHMMGVAWGGGSRGQSPDGACGGGRRRSPFSGAEQGDGAWWRADEAQQQQQQQQQQQKPLCLPFHQPPQNHKDVVQQGQEDAERQTRHAVHFECSDGDSWNTSMEHRGPSKMIHQQQQQQQQQQCQEQREASLLPRGRDAGLPSSFEWFDAQQGAQRIHTQSPLLPPHPSQRRSASGLPMHSPHIPSGARVHAHVRSPAPHGSRSLSHAGSGWGDGRGANESGRCKSTAGNRLSPERASSRPGIGGAGMGASSHRRSRKAHRKSGASPDKSLASSGGASEQDFDEPEHWIADEPMLAQGDLEAAIPLLLEQRYDELHFLLRHAVPSTTLHPADHAHSATQPRASLAGHAVREPHAPCSHSAHTLTEAPHGDFGGIIRSHGAPHCPAHPPAGAGVGTQGAQDEGGCNEVGAMDGDFSSMGHNADAVEEERRPAATERDVRAHLENEHLRLKKLVFFLQRQRQCRTFAASGLPDIEAPASPQTLIHQHFETSRRRRATTADGHTRVVPRHSADFGSRHRRSQPGVYLSGGTGEDHGGCERWAQKPVAASPTMPAALGTSAGLASSAAPEPQPPSQLPSQPSPQPQLAPQLPRGYPSGGVGEGHGGGRLSGGGWEKETSAASPPPVVPATLEPSAASSSPMVPGTQPPRTHTPSQPQLASQPEPLQIQEVPHLHLLPSQSSQHQEQHLQQQQQQEENVHHEHQSCHPHPPHQHHHYQQDGRVLHQHQFCHAQQPHKLQHQHHQHESPHGHKQRLGQHMLDSPFADGWVEEDEFKGASGGSGTDKELEEWDDDWTAASEVMDGVVDEITLEWAEVVQGKVRWYFKSHTRLLWIIWHTMQRVIIALLSLTMPRIDRSDVPFSPFTAAVLMPVIGPCAVAIYMKWWDPFFALAQILGGSGDPLSANIGRLGVAEPLQESPPSPLQQMRSPSSVSPARETFVVAAAEASAKRQLLLLFGTCACVWLWVVARWPRDGRLKGHVLGVAVVLTFLGAMAWMDAAANELVGLVLVAGQLLRIPVALLSATVLAWGNCMSDTVCNLTMAKDGYPTMAITACFASPMFILLAGSAFVTIFGTHAAGNGVMAMPSDLSTRALYITSFTNMTMWGLLTPLLFKFRLDYRTAVIGFIFYAGFQAMFVTLVIMQQQQQPSE